MDHAEKVMHLVPISEMVDKMQPCGSRVTCNPPPMDTDEDYLLLIDPSGLGSNQNSSDVRLWNLEHYLRDNGWEVGGSLPTDCITDLNPDEQFHSWTKSELNLIITLSPTFYGRFMAATSVSKRLNLMNKPDRIALFQAVLYGNIVDES